MVAENAADKTCSTFAQRSPNEAWVSTRVNNALTLNSPGCTPLSASAFCGTMRYDRSQSRKLYDVRCCLFSALSGTRDPTDRPVSSEAPTPCETASICHLQPLHRACTSLGQCQISSKVPGRQMITMCMTELQAMPPAACPHPQLKHPDHTQYQQLEQLPHGCP